MPGGDRDGRPGARAAGDEPGPVGVRADAVRRADADEAGGELVEVGLADDDRAGGDERGDGRRVDVGGRRRRPGSRRSSGSPATSMLSFTASVVPASGSVGAGGHGGRRRRRPPRRRVVALDQRDPDRRRGRRRRCGRRRGATALRPAVIAARSRTRRSTSQRRPLGRRTPPAGGRGTRRSRRRGRRGTPGARPGGTSSLDPRSPARPAACSRPLVEQLVGRRPGGQRSWSNGRSSHGSVEVRPAAVAVPHLHRAPDELVAAGALHAVDAQVGAADADRVLRRPRPRRVVLRGDQAVAGIERRGDRRAEVHVAEPEHEVARRRTRCGGRRRRRRGR